MGWGGAEEKKRRERELRGRTVKEDRGRGKGIEGKQGKTLLREGEADNDGKGLKCRSVCLLM